MTHPPLLAAVFVAVCTTLAVSSDDTTNSETAPDIEKATVDLTDDLQDTLQDSLTGELSEALGELVNVGVGLALTVLDETVSEDSLNAAFEEAWTTQAEQHDTNQDGGLSRAEVSEMPHFKLDDDGNELSDEEFEALLDETFETMDLDEDGQITKEETQAYFKSLTSDLSELIESTKNSLEVDLPHLELVDSEDSFNDSEIDQ